MKEVLCEKIFTKGTRFSKRFKIFKIHSASRGAGGETDGHEGAERPEAGGGGAEIERDRNSGPTSSLKFIVVGRPCSKF